MILTTQTVPGMKSTHLLTQIRCLVEQPQSVEMEHIVLAKVEEGPAHTMVESASGYNSQTPHCFPPIVFLL